MIIILSLFLTTVLANSHEKYIDLLPEEEKQQFLNTIARRIMESVNKTDNGQKISTEITDEQLKDHSKFVQDILQQESKHMRRRRSHDTSGSESDDFKVKPIDSETSSDDGSDKTDTASDNENRSNGRRNNDETLEESSTNALPVQRETKNFDEENNQKIKLQQTTSKEEEKNIEMSTIFVEVQTEETQDLKLNEKNIITTQATEVKPLRVGNSSDENSSNSGKESTARTATENDVNLITSTTAETQTIQNDVKVETRSYVETTTSIGDEYLAQSSTINPEPEKFNNTESSTSTDKGTTDIFIDLASFAATTESSVARSDKDSTLLPEEAERNIATTVNYRTVPEKSALKKNSKTKTVTSTPLIGLTPASIQRTGKLNKPRKNGKIENNIPIKSHVMKKDKADDTKTKPLIQGNEQPYNVFEIPVQDPSEASPFLRIPEPMQNQPSFVPVYKYSPKFAFYNPANRLGPNAVEENSLELDILREGKDIKGEKPEAPEFILQLNDELRKFGVYKKKPREYSREHIKTTSRPKDSELEEDDNMVMRLPNSDENLHPINNMKNGLKTHIQAIRDVLKKNRILDLKKRKDVVPKDITDQLEHNDPIVDKYLAEHNDDDAYSALRAHYDHKKKNKIHYYFDKLNHIHHKTKGLHHLQGEKSPEASDANALLLLNYAANRHDDGKGFPSDMKKEDTDINTIVKILSVTDEKDVFTSLEKMQNMSLKLMRRNEDVKVSIYMKVLKNMMEKDSAPLKQYDWLATTVRIQSALEKLFRLIQKMRDNESLHPADVEILKYMIFIHNFSLELKGAFNIKRKLQRKVNLLPKSRKKREQKIIKEKGLINRAWLYLRTLLPELTADNELKNLNDFLLDVEKALFNLHDAITNIARVTNYRNQNWYENMRQLYLTTDEKHLRELLLHISFSRMVDLIEHSCESGLEDDFVEYMKTHKKESKRTLEEILFVSKIIDEIKSNLD